MRGRIVHAPFDFGRLGFGAASAPASSVWDPSKIGNMSWWAEARAAANDTAGGVCVQLQDLSGRGNHMTAASAGARPPVLTSPLLSPLISPGNRAALQFTTAGGFWLRKLTASLGGAAGPITIVMLVRQVTWTSGALMLSYGSTNLPRVRQSGVSNLASFLASNTGIDSVAVGNTADGSTTLGAFGDGLWRLLICTWDGTTQRIYRSNLQTLTMDLEDSDANANAALADGGTLSLGATVTGTGVPNFEWCGGFAFRAVDASLNPAILSYFLNILGRPFASPASTAKEIIMMGDSLTTGTDRNVASYRRHFWENLRIANPNVNFCGTLTTRAYDQPAGYPSGHESISGQTIAGIELFTAGFWTGTNVVPGQSGSPAPGSRGDFEVLAARPPGQGGGQNNGGVIIILQGGNNNASSGAVDTAAFIRLVERVINTHGRVHRCYVCTLPPRTDNGAAATRLETFNSAIPGLVTTMQGAGYPVALIDWSASAGYQNSWLQADGLHPTGVGGQWMADQAYAAMQANGDLA